MKRTIYLDFNATTPMAPEVAKAMLPYLEEGYGNPSSLHWAGLPARDAVEEARSQVAALLCCDATEIVFTSGGTEANNLAIKGVYFSRLADVERPHVIASCVEHPSVLETCRFLESLGAEIFLLPVDSFGMVKPEDVSQEIRGNTVLISIMHANNEVGTIQPISEIASIARSRGITFHTDAAQSIGKIPVDIEELGVDLLTLAGHKLYGPKGVGALFIREGIRLTPGQHGAGHEAGRRAGTENVAGIVGLGAACELARRYCQSDSVCELREYFWSNLQKRFGNQVELNGHPGLRLPNTISVSFRGRDGFDLLSRIPQLAASTGAACHSGSMQMSPVLQAMGVPEVAGLGTIRFSLGRETTIEEIEVTMELLSNELRA